ncbi:ankyrin [Neocallimastix californiae]|uniref:Ankyrin n=1 Tax=Neocallimastix californiae TaxID=1754190 RepID=A0A1Y2B169_9FUNG|nr:ankyrin [Neocallimastix californiae]|eukprot:ORY28553.1 ankyrin [Neocallimastix californiae]
MIVPQYFDINSRNENEESLLDIASLDFNYDMMVYLINEGAEIDYNKSSFVSFSSEKEKIKNIGYMLLYSIAYGKTEISKYFINKGADINGDLYNVNGRNLLYYGKCILGTNEYNCIQVTPLIVAILKQNLEITKYLISKGADVNKFGIDSNHLMNKNNKYITPLVCAIYNDNKDIGKCLIDHKVNVNDDYIQNKYDVKVKEKNGIIYEKPLYYAIKMKSEKMVKLILNLDVKIKKWRIGKYLRKLGAKPSKTNDRNRPSKKNKKNNKRKVIYNEDSTEDDDDDSDWKEDDKKRKKKKTRKN